MSMKFSGAGSLQNNLHDCGDDEINEYLSIFNCVLLGIKVSDTKSSIKQDALYYMANRLMEVQFNDCED